MTDPIVAASVALMMLRLSTPSLTSASQVVLLPDTQRISFEEAVSIMAAMRKPVKCSARDSDGVLEVECHSFVDSSETANRLMALEAKMELLRSHLRESGAPPNSLFVVEAEGGRRISASYSALCYWLESYHMEGWGFGWSIEPPDDRALQVGAVGRVRLFFSQDLGSK